MFMKVAILSISFFFASTALQAQKIVPDGTTSAGHTSAAAPVPQPYLSAGAINHVRTWTLQKPLTDASLITNSIANSDASMQTEYSDGLGRPIELVSKALSPLGRDVVAPVLYDAFGRLTYDYLPYTSSGTDGSFKIDPFNEQAAFMQSQYTGQGELFFYERTDFEASPLNRALKTLPPGNSWVGSERGSTTRYEINAANEVRIWTIDHAVGSRPSSNTYYDAGQLYRTVSIDEAGKRVVEYRDKSGQVILKKVELITDADILSHDGWLCTYYIFDDMHHLRFVLPPKGTEAVVGDGLISVNTAGELCFRYEYDNRGRMIIKKLPGAAEVWMVYDCRDRLVFNQDGNMRAKGQWLASIYEGMNRLVLTAMMVYTGTRDDLAAYAADPLHIAGSSTVPLLRPSNLSAELLISSRQAGRILYQATSGIEFTPEFSSEPGAEFVAEIINNQTSPASLIVEGTPIPSTGVSAFALLTQTYYDDYGHTSKSYDAADNAKLLAGTCLYPEFLPASASNATRGLPTTAKVWLMLDPDNLSQGQWLETTSFFDDKGRTVQVQSDNEKDGWETITTRYDFSDKPISSYHVHQNPQSAAGRISILTLMSYDIQARLIDIKKQINETDAFRTIVQNEYDESGRPKTKHLGNGLQDLTYDYNIRGWVTALNKDYVNSMSTAGRFGECISYDYGFSTKQYTGNISGVRWRSAGDGEARAYGFDYDNINRLMKADFTQNNGGWNNSAHVDYSLKMGDGTNPSSAYDRNGNIKRMQQWALTFNQSPKIDDLTYMYAQNSNKLLAITDNAAIQTQRLGDFTDGNVTGNDYGYDVNGNLISDLNKGINGSTGLDQTTNEGISYNYLNMPFQLAVKKGDGSAKGTVRYLYDAKGTRHRKTVNEKNISVSYNGASYVSDLTVTDTYQGSFVYESRTYSNANLSSLNTIDELQFFTYEEGRIRPRNDPATHNITGFSYDYFIKDHLGDVRMVLTDEQKIDLYEPLSFEDQNMDLQNGLWENRQGNSIDVSSARTAVVGNTGQAFAMLTRKSLGSIGATKLLKVMAGDRIHTKVDYFYTSTNANNSNADPLSSIVNSVTAALTNSALPLAAVHGNESAVATGLSADNDFNTALQTAATVNPANTAQEAPKAYLCVLFFNEQFQYDKDNSQVIPVNYFPNSWKTIDLFSSNAITAGKNGYAYVYFTNESDELVYFDNFNLSHERGPVLEETHYYPFGLVMQAISSKSAGALVNKWKYNGKELQSSEFSDGTGLEIYDYGARMYDPQIGRWHKTDGKAELYFATSPYVYALNQPVNAIDPDGNLVIFINGNHFSSSAPGAGYWRTTETQTTWLRRPGTWGRFDHGEEQKKTITRNFDQQVMDHFGDNNARYYDGALGGWQPLRDYMAKTNTNAAVRMAAGLAAGKQDAASIISSLARDKSGNIVETIKIITHSMGGAYGKGFVMALKDYIKTLPVEQQKQIKITLVADFDPYQAGDLVADPDILTKQFKHTGSWNILGMGWLANENEQGLDKKDIVTNSGTSTDHSIFTFFNDISSLQEGTYKWDEAAKKWVKQ